MKYGAVEREGYALMLNSIETVWSVTAPEQEENYFNIRVSDPVLGVLKRYTWPPTLNAS